MLLIKAPRNQLLQPLQAVAGIVEKKHTLPILSNVLIERAGETLTLLASDSEIQIRTTSNAGLDPQNAAITVSARKLQDILRTLPEHVDVSLDADERRLTVRAGKSRFTLQILPAEEFPRMRGGEGEPVEIKLKQNDFRKQLGLVQYAMAQADIRYYLNGMLMAIAGGQLRMVATDGHRLAYCAHEAQTPEPGIEVILPRKTVLELYRLLADSDAALTMRVWPNQVQFLFNDIELTSKLIDGKFPDYNRVIPQNHPKLLQVTRTELAPALQRAAILTVEKLRGVRIVLSPGSLKLLSINTEQEEAQEELEVAYDGEGLDIGFNVTYLIDVLTHVDAENFELRLNDANSSALFSLPGNDNFKYVVMPMRI
ncbi:MAG: DNA polymerase III subunit beta [Rhodocyclaceae bacterium]|nr:DNA polymerase III subunit beta [Rhodocyclaceae bacterium]